MLEEPIFYSLAGIPCERAVNVHYISLYRLEFKAAFFESFDL